MMKTDCRFTYPHFIVAIKVEAANADIDFNIITNRLQLSLYSIILDDTKGNEIYFLFNWCK